MLAGRGTECARLDQLLADAHLGRSAALVLRGEPGIGKSALLEYAAERAEGCLVLRAAGVEWEMELPFAGLHQLCTEMLEGRTRLPAPQRDALATAFGLTSGTQPDRFLVGLALLSLLSDAAEEKPVVCVVDDVQWLDRSSAQLLAFVARRLAAESVVLLFAERDRDGHEELVGLPELQVGGLPDASARTLLASVITAPLDERVRDRILAETRGNPLALLELPRGSPPGGMAGGFGLPRDGSLPGRIEASFRRRVEQLPSATQRLLLVAAADPTGEPTLMVRAARELGLSIEELAPAEADGLLELGLQVAFRHPLLRSAVYRSAPLEARRAAHRALAAATDAELDPDRHAWHRAHSTVGSDEDVASELERSAGRARARGGLAAAAAFLERAAALTADPRVRARRAREAAASKLLAGDPQSALTLLATARAGPLDETERGHASAPPWPDLAGSKTRRRGAAAPGRGGQAARAVRPGSRSRYAFGGDTSRDCRRPAWPGHARRRRGGWGGTSATGGTSQVDLLLDGLAVRFTDGYAASAPALKRALVAIRDEGERGAPSVRWPWVARRVAPDLFADDIWDSIATRGVQLARATGALSVLPLGLNNLANLHCLEGDLDGAAALLDEADAIAAAIGVEPMVFGTIVIGRLSREWRRTRRSCSTRRSPLRSRGARESFSPSLTTHARFFTTGSVATRWP